MNATVEKALSLWGMKNTEFLLIAARENHVYRIDHNGMSFAMRLHRQDLRSDTELRSELEWMDAVAIGGLNVPAPIKSHTGDFLQRVDGFQIDVLTWLEGQTVGKTGEELSTTNRYGLFYGIGHEMARLHNISDDWLLPDGFTRCAWDRAGLLGEAPIWDRFWDNPTLSDEDRDLFITARNKAQIQLKEIESTLDYGLIHADLVRENIIINGDKIQLIDFDDGGFGFRMFDLATTLLKNLDELDYSTLRETLISGYSSQRKVETNTLDLFILLRSFTYVGWIMTRMKEDGSHLRAERYINKSRTLAKNYLAQ